MSIEIMSAITTTLASVRMVTDVAKAMKDMDERTKIVGAVYDVNEKLMATMEAAMTAQEKQAALTQRIAELERENEQLKNWDAERDQYTMTEVKPGFVAYRRKPEIETVEPAHYLCAHCFSNYQKGFLNFETILSSRSYRCARCKTKVEV